MASRKDPSEEALLDWYTDLRPPIVDIVGDFAGRELFLIHGEALMRQCLVEARVDFDRGFQLLHAIQAMEKFLANLKKVDCNFDIVFFHDLEDVSASHSKIWDAACFPFQQHRKGLHYVELFDVDDYHTKMCQIKYHSASPSAYIWDAGLWTACKESQM